MGNAWNLKQSDATDYIQPGVYTIFDSGSPHIVMPKSQYKALMK